ncbi:ABC-2 transporter permease [Ureibacillus sp. FSL K6-8385]|uniref:ABC-2 transporter permease n=1 Tax=Ureibacillus terrenus TaxID=118246 RepID=A0A540V4I3_9BACL|nr:ABC-2 transporter permease [Ureibacillus terrenus]MED3660449.1 ABC-2 transporter permease [Ureibacillus terrenus]MED3762604.1 ABC-2 transporter permease [Ureibacillus terrenus]TQE91667.1 ABC-2 transporter permease [Ureibacillus terrenus]
MRALILKDLYVMFYQKNLMAILTVLFFIASFFFGDPGLLTVFLSVLCITQINMLLGYDETSNWYRFVYTLPVKKADIVKSKYILSLILLFFIVLIILPVSLITNIMAGSAIALKETFLILSIVGSSLLIILGIIIPVIIKFGIQKGRIFILASIFIPVIAVNVFSNGNIVVRLIEFIDLISLISLPVAAILFYLSYKLSVSILKNKEF